ncbi:MAG: hypothetical protein LBJ43_03775, partial [Propionibacteriaceae bacterium]|nr:hypothetical protein [Propionibacteriaceae bacterium]
MLVRVRGVGWGAAAGLRFVAVVLVSGLLVAVAVLGSRATARVAAVLDENWRGSYDILITAPGQGFSAVATGGLVDSNFVATAGEGGISVADLARIRAIAGVEVAAPIGMVGSLRQQAFTPFLFVRDDVDYGQEITEPLVSAMPSDDLLMRVTATTVLLAADGSDEQVVSQGTGRVWLRARPKGELWDFEVVYGLGSSMGFMPIVQGTGFRVPLGALPTFASSVLAVDPVAEAQLWGDEYAVFLEPLAELSESSAAPTGREVSDAWVDFMCRGSGVTPGVGFPCSLQSSMINTAVREAENTETAPALVVPLVVNQGAGRDLVLRVEVAVTDQDVSGKDLDQSFLDTLTNADFVPYSVSELDVSAVTSPFSSPDLMVLLPGSQPAGNDWGVFATETALTPMLVGRPDYETVVAPSGEVAFEVVPGDVVGSDGLTMQESGMAEWGMDIGVGLVRAYRSTVKTGAATGALPAPLGVFSLDVLVDPNAGDVSYVPVGYSSQVDTWQVLDSGERLPVLANLSGVDFITMAPGAFTDLLGGAALRGATPIDAIRVRVAGITGYTPEAQQRIIDV